MSDRPPIVGRVLTGSASYALLADGTWEVQCPWGRDEASESLLKIRYEDAPRGPSEGRPGAAILADWAQRIGGTVEMPAAIKAEGVVY